MAGNLNKGTGRREPLKKKCCQLSVSEINPETFGVSYSIAVQAVTPRRVVVPREGIPDVLVPVCVQRKDKSEVYMQPKAVLFPAVPNFL